MVLRISVAEDIIPNTSMIISVAMVITEKKRIKMKQRMKRSEVENIAHRISLSYTARN